MSEVNSNKIQKINEILNFYEGIVMVNSPSGWREMSSQEKEKAKLEELAKIEAMTKKEAQKCPVCGTSFVPHATQVYCSEECRKIALKEREKKLNWFNETPRRNPSVESLKQTILRKK